MGNTPNVANLTVVVEVIAKEKDNQMKYLKPVFLYLLSFFLDVRILK
ncbi:hypothetical protein ADICYQ_1921 [Cyclobacterium qasimii M12-11B]|uniref:Uncharacterized protein n=1 Tax=Cyclobacterium qasimii M12-11B TaxID=641524 RepID=S7VG96_9BACT|nr:hypothetical protein ADICYQ_1921 [Cyclobacterium qasimii M12-11B]